ncbi:MAG: hypothetical protein KBS78_02640, partial [Bacteroidales bacterium]|nr:hypothetical protein [Candidatus Cryptobacteroides faecihippi]
MSRPKRKVLKRFGRITQSHTAEALGGWRDVHFLNSLTGKPLGSLETATLPSGQANSLETGFSYDRNGNVTHDGL